MAKSAREKKERTIAAYTELVAAYDEFQKLLEVQLRNFGLTNGQYGVLEAVLRHRPMSQVHLAGITYRSTTDVHVIVNALARRSLVVRRANETDRRKVTVHLTPEGRRLIARVAPMRAKVIRARMSALRQREQELLRRLCEKLQIGNPISFMRELTWVDRDEGWGG